VDKLGGSYIPQAVGRRLAYGEAGDEPSSQRTVLLAHFSFQLLRLAFLVTAAYGTYSNRPAIAWLFGILFVHSLLDSTFYLQPNLMNIYLLFTVVFYYCRWVMGWGSASTTIYTEDAPNWVKVLKDIVWFGFVAAITLRALFRPRFDRRMPLWFSGRGMILVILLLIYLALPTLSLVYGRGGLFEIVLYDLRYPLEYVPFVFLFPFVLRGESSFKYLRTFVPLVILTLLFLAVEIFSGRRTGFGGSGYFVRYGSIFGSPNDYGVFLMLSVTVLLAFLTEKAVRWSPKVVALLILCLGALAATVSLSAVFAMVFVTIVLLLFSRNKIKGTLALAMSVLLITGVYFAFPAARISRYLAERIENLSSLREGSAYAHYLSVLDAEAAIQRFDSVEYLVGTFQSRKNLMLPETYYLRTLYVRGAANLVILLTIIGLTLVEGYRRYRAALGSPIKRGLFLAATLGVAGFAFASLFIPYFDVFPSNFYFWFLAAIIWCEPMQAKEYSASLARPGPRSSPKGNNLVSRVRD
jgi:hypothetical protein